MPLPAFYEGDLSTLINDFTKNFNILSHANQKKAKSLYPSLPSRFKSMV